METPDSDSSVPPPHVLIFPFPIQGHMNCMLYLSEMLVYSGFHITLLLTDHNLSLLRNNSSSSNNNNNSHPSSLPNIPRLRVLSIPDCLPADHPRNLDGWVELLDSLKTNACPLYKSLLLDLCKMDDVDADGFPAVTCVIADGILPFMIDASEEVGVPAIAFRTASASSLWIYYCIPQLIQSGEVPFRDGADWDEPINSIPGMESFLRRRDLPSPCRLAKNPEDKVLQLLATCTAHSERTRGLILNTLETLESISLEQIRAHMPTTYAIGPLHEMVRAYRSQNNVCAHDKSVSLWHQDCTCMTWLDQQPHRSVIYVSYGSVAVMTRESLIEFWIALVNSGEHFLWVVRSDLLRGEEWTNIWDSLSLEVRKGTEERGCIVSWVPQVEVLAHPAVGCFLTHSGWNSTLESIVGGVPMLCWPFAVDQQINSRLVGEVWRIGLDMKDACDKTTIEKMVRAAMNGETASEIRKNAHELAKMVKNSVVEGGSSFENFQRLIEHIKSLCKRNVE
ncbi:Glycosyltransferase [Rhynchospora pubera]|uniref:Glycosyltransferase n=1 Tax=Rhynchospora pubera TaxID=906938 RepID=A0AAV8C081_9POAL|nr:Glycosyltransferase [Rhynchospora pubera]